MSLLVVGTMAYDSVKTPFGHRDRALGGSATYFSLCASRFTDVNLVAVIGEDFDPKDLALLSDRGVNIEGVERQAGKSFHWKGEYGFDLNEAKTLDTQLNVLATFDPKLPESYTKSDYVFLANIDPRLQQKVLDQVTAPKLVACDTMNFWIDSAPDALKKTFERVDVVIINEGEARMLAKTPNLVKAAREIQSIGPKTVIVKRGEYGSLLFHGADVFSGPAYPLEEVFDPTGAGDTFAGGFMGHIARQNPERLTGELLRQAIVMGGVMASFTVERFSVERLASLEAAEIADRFRAMKRLTHFDDLTGAPTK
ncbi:MAG: bifunctional hydroxymethylpyrimidine kinase/phosphomethylpyrimidine kinase [Nitrospinae bacterium]|nr:bifunctional hydroxymethylpyrimidine kinase/phosphomethylpyrimidine kinase [Nitrospinota bacterium]